MREPDSQDAESPVIDDDLKDEEDEVFFRDVSEDLDDEEQTSYAILLILAVGGCAVGDLLLHITLTSAVVLKEYSGDWAWVLAPAPMLLFGLASLWQYDSNWLQRLGAAALGFALAQYIMIAIGFATLDI
ncbi:MAG: hypothetical protein F4Y88_01245 [Chloroflexi bacterium]|nr:hypothetical protein [Chloroflexota bacterium]